MSFSALAPAFSKSITWVISAALFFNALTIDLIQPLFGRLIVPQAGGSPGVWNFIAANFGLATVIGFLAAWGLTWARRAVQLKLLGAGWLATAVLLCAANDPIDAIAEQPDSWLSFASQSAAFCAAILLLAACQFLVPWLVARCNHARLPSPFFLIAFCHLGSLFGILGYPLAIDPFFTLATQMIALKGLFLGVGALVLGSAFLLRRMDQGPSIEEALRIGVSRPAWLLYCRWVWLASLAAALVLGVTTYVSTTISAIPMFWILPLALYETSLVVAFARLRHAESGVLGWVVQGLALLAWAPLVVLVVLASGIGSGGKLLDTYHIVAFFEGLLLFVMLPHRWTLLVQFGL